jgi:hypothetical protein
VYPSPWTLTPFTLSANASSWFIGSTPGESTKMIGVDARESPKAPERSNAGGVTNRSPSWPETNADDARVILSGRTHRSASSFWNGVRASSQRPGSGCVCGVRDS